MNFVLKIKRIRYDSIKIDKKLFSDNLLIYFCYFTVDKPLAMNLRPNREYRKRERKRKR